MHSFLRVLKYSYKTLLTQVLWKTEFDSRYHFGSACQEFWSLRTVRSNRLLESFCVYSLIFHVGGRNTINFRFKMKWQQLRSVRLRLKAAKSICRSFRFHSCYQPVIPICFLQLPLCPFDHVPLPDFFPSCPCTMLNKIVTLFFFSPSPNHTLVPPSLFFAFSVSFSPSLHLLSFICSLLYSCHVSILSIYPNPLPHTSLRLFPFTLFASDSVRQPLSAWLKSSGPTGRAKPWACFPSERLLFAHSGNYRPSCIVSPQCASTSWSSTSHSSYMLDKTNDCTQSRSASPRACRGCSVLDVATAVV